MSKTVAGKPSSTERSAPSAAAAASAPSAQPLALLLVCAAAFIGPLLAGVPDAGPVVINSTQPDTRIWTPLVCALCLFAAAALTNPRWHKQTRDNTVTIGLVVLFFLTIVLVVAHWAIESRFGPRNVDPMLYAACYWCGLAALGLSCARLSMNTPRIAQTICWCVVAAAGLESAWGVHDYLIQIKVNHIAGWREFGTSTPDYLAAYLVMSIPITIAMFLRAPSGQDKLPSWLTALSLVLQLALLPTTGSRTSLISLGVALLVFGAALGVCLARGLKLDPIVRARLLAIAALAVVGVAVGAGPLLHRLAAQTMATQAYSLEFRKYTWHSAWDMLTRNPLGVGPGLFASAYPPYEIVDFTRVAHNGYLQFADEFGFIGLALLAGIVAAALVSGIRRLAAPAETGHEEWGAQEINSLPLLTAGLIAALSAGLVQNCMDSDLQMTIDGALFFIVIGLLGGGAPHSVVKPEAAVPGPSRRAVLPWIFAAISGALAVVSLWYMLVGAVEASDILQAASLDPLSGQLLSSVAWDSLTSESQSAEPQQQALDQCAQQLRHAAEIEPLSNTYRRLAELYLSTGQINQALQAAQQGLVVDPKSLQLLLDEARAADPVIESGDSAAQPFPGQALDYPRAIDDYQEINRLEHSPYGRVRAVPELVEYHFAFADYALGHDALQRRNFPQALAYLTDAQSVLQGYLDEDHNERMGEEGANFSALNSGLSRLCSVVMDDQARAYTQLGQPAQAQQAEAQKAKLLRQFQSLGSSPDPFAQ